ncbi:MAG: amidohydrolase family protein [Lentisphaeria bacterium]|nr:amidohydrolase family protein [Lentisphaeria bacterium]
MGDCRILDSWVSYGPRPGRHERERWTLDQLVEDLDFYGIAGALVRHEQLLCYDSMFTNRRVVRELEGRRDRLFPCWGAMPANAGDFPLAPDFGAEMDDAGVRAVLLTPALHGYPIHPDVLTPLAREMNRRGVLIAITLTELGRSYGAAVALCGAFAECPVLIAEATWADWRLVASILDACPNACVEFSAFQANRGVEVFAERYGIERVYFGSGLPRRSAGAARGFVDWSLLSDDDAARFAGGNLADVLDVEIPPAPALDDSADAITLTARSGAPLDLPVLDAHCHVLDDGLNGAGARYVMIKGDSLNMLELTRRMGVDLTAMMSWAGTVSNDAPTGNALIEQVVARSPEEIVGLSTCDPSHQTTEEIVALCERLHGELGFRGCKPYHQSRTSYSAPGYTPYWEYANAHHLYGLLHIAAHAGGMGAAAELAGKYPDVTFLIAHSGSSWPFAQEVADLGKKYDNVCAELTYTAALNGVVEWLCEQLGSDRVLFGTDAPMRDPRPQLGWCVHTRLSEEDKRRVLGGNFARILLRGNLPGHALPAVVEQAAQ